MLEVQNNNKLKAIIGLILTNLFWAGNIFVSKVIVGEIPPLQANTLRWVVAVLILTPFIYKQVLLYKAEIARNIGSLMILSFLGVSIYNAFLYSAAYTTSGINIAVICTLTPTVTFLFVWILSKIRPTQGQLIGLVFGVIGVLLLITKGELSALLSMSFSQGDVLMLLAVLAWSIYTAILSKEKSEGTGMNLPPTVFLFITILLGVLMSLPLSLWEYGQQGGFELTTSTVLALLYIGILPSLAAYWLFNYSVPILGANITSLSSYLLPLFTAIISVIFLGESLQWFHFVGQLLVFIGFCFAIKKTKTKT